MKKFILLMLLTICTLGAKAQIAAGQSSFGAMVGYGFETNNVTIGMDYRYCITDEFRIAPSLSYMIKKDNLKSTAVDLNLHYVFNLGSRVAFYPLAGLDLSFWKLGFNDTDLKVNKTRFGANFGMGVEVYPADQLVVGFEAKYLIIKDMKPIELDQAMIDVRVGFCF